MSGLRAMGMSGLMAAAALLPSVGRAADDAPSASPVDRMSLSTAGQASTVASRTPPPASTFVDDVPWFDNVDYRNHDINDGFSGLRDRIHGVTDSVNRALNPKMITQYGRWGQVGGYDWRFQPLAVRVDPYVTLRLNKLGAGVRAEAALMRAQIEKKDGDTVSGVRGEIYGRRELARGEKLDLHGPSSDNTSNRFFGPRAEVFRQRRSEHGDWKQAIEYNVGASYDVTASAPLTYARAQGRFYNEAILQPYLGPGSRLRVEVEAGVQHNWRTDETLPFYRTFAGAMKPYQMFGHKVEVDTGLEVRGQRGDALQIRPQVRARLYW